MASGQRRKAANGLFLANQIYLTVRYSIANIADECSVILDNMAVMTMRATRRTMHNASNSGSEISVCSSHSFILVLKMNGNINALI